MTPLNELLLKPEVQEFIRNSEKSDLPRLLLKESPFPGITSRELAVQISGREKAREKLPIWYHMEGLYYPETIHMEQCSSETAAAYKAQLIPKGTLIDLTAGLGVDTYYFSRIATRVHYCEQNHTLAAIARHNLARLGVESVTFQVGDSLAWLFSQRPQVEMIYLDPARRTRGNRRVYQLSETEPDVIPILPRLFDRAPAILIKTSPMLDIQDTSAKLGAVREVHIVAIDNEVKELLWLLRKGFEGEAVIRAVNIRKDGRESMEFTFSEEKNLPDRLGEPQAYLYEPNAALLKSGGFKSLGKQRGLAKLDVHTHLYTAQEPLEFPGRGFRIVNVIPYRPRAIKGLYAQGNVSTRNFPENVAGIRKRFGIRDGGPTYLFFTRSAQKGLILIECEKI